MRESYYLGVYIRGKVFGVFGRVLSGLAPHCMDARLVWRSQDKPHCKLPFGEEPPQNQKYYSLQCLLLLWAVGVLKQSCCSKAVQTLTYKPEACTNTIRGEETFGRRRRPGPQRHPCGPARRNMFRAHIKNSGLRVRQASLNPKP